MLASSKSDQRPAPRCSSGLHLQLRWTHRRLPLSSGCKVDLVRPPCSASLRFTARFRRKDSTQQLLSRTTTRGTRRQTCCTLTTQLEQDSATQLTQIMDCQQLSSMQERISTASSLSSSHSTLSISPTTSMFLENLMP